MIRILTDSACDISPADAALLDVIIVPLNVTFEDGTVIRDAVDMTPDEYYVRLAACEKLPTTSQPSPEQFAAEFAAAKAAGDETVVITISSQLSGTSQAAHIAAELEDYHDVYFVDSGTVCLAEALLVKRAVRLRAAGNSASRIAEALEQAKAHLHLVAVIDDLKYLRKGGRLPAAAAVAGGMLGIKPLITIKNGKVAMAGKARGLPGAYVALFKKIDEMGGIDRSGDVIAGYSSHRRELEPIRRYFTQNLGLPAPETGRIGCVIGTHAGPGAFGVAFFDPQTETPA